MIKKDKVDGQAIREAKKIASKKKKIVPAKKEPDPAESQEKGPPRIPGKK
jgi:hypothetical protein